MAYAITHSAFLEPKGHCEMFPKLARVSGDRYEAAVNVGPAHVVCLPQPQRGVNVLFTEILRRYAHKIIIDPDTSRFQVSPHWYFLGGSDYGRPTRRPL
jgi:hypothetical protein